MQSLFRTIVVRLTVFSNIILSPSVSQWNELFYFSIFKTLPQFFFKSKCAWLILPIWFYCVGKIRVNHLFCLVDTDCRTILKLTIKEVQMSCWMKWNHQKFNVFCHMGRVKISIKISRYYNRSLELLFVMQFTILGYDHNHTIYSFTMSCQKNRKRLSLQTIMKCFSCCMDLERNWWHELHTIISLRSYIEFIIRYCNTLDKKY